MGEQIWRQSELKPRSKVRAEKVATDGQTDGFSPFYSRLASVPTLSCKSRLATTMTLHA